MSTIDGQGQQCRANRAGPKHGMARSDWARHNWNRTRAGTVRWLVPCLGRVPSTVSQHGHGPVSSKARLDTLNPGALKSRRPLSTGPRLVSHSLASPVVYRGLALVSPTPGDLGMIRLRRRLTSALQPPVGCSTAPPHGPPGFPSPGSCRLPGWWFGHGFGYDKLSVFIFFFL